MTQSDLEIRAPRETELSDLAALLVTQLREPSPYRRAGFAPLPRTRWARDLSQ